MIRFKTPAPKARPITGDQPPKESRAQRVKILARTPGTTITVLDDARLAITAEDDAVAKYVAHRVHHACGIIGIGSYQWTVEPDLPLSFSVTLE